jgi:glyoxylase-like metal-dependent hydrolase (beta-lactamase superfamily II)
VISVTSRASGGIIRPACDLIHWSGGGREVDNGMPADRDRRLGEALRENLKKRKAQARARADAPVVAPDGPEVVCLFHEATFTASYLVFDTETREAAIIDSVLDYDGAAGRVTTTHADALLAAAKDRGLTIAWILETHVHADHLSAAQHLCRATGAPLAIGAHVSEVQRTFRPIFGADDLTPDGSQFDRLLAEGESLPLGRFRIETLETPGHTPACVSYLIGDALFVGDTLFMPDYGTARCDFPGGDPATLHRSIRRLLSLPRETRMFVCHDYKAPGRDAFVWETTVGAQRDGNVHIKDGIGEEDFVALRRERDAKLAMPALILPSVQVNMRAGHFPPKEADGSVYIRVPIGKL